MNRYIYYIFALLAVVTLIMTGCGGNSGDFVTASTSDYVLENSVPVNPDGSVDAYTSSGVSLKAEQNTFASDVKITITENKAFEGISGAFHNTSSLFTISAEKTQSSIGKTPTKITNVEKPVILSVPNNSKEPGVYYIGVRANSSQPWRYALVNDRNSRTNPLPVYSRASADNNASEFYVSTYNVDFQFSVFVEKEIDTSKTVITDFIAEAEPSEYELVNNNYKNDITVKATILGDNIGNLTSNNYIVEIGFLNDDPDNYTTLAFPINGATSKHEVSDPDAGAGNKYKHTITLTNISDYSNNTLSFGIGTSKLTQKIFPADFTITVKVDEAPKIVAYSQTKSITLTSSKANGIKVVSASPADGATDVLTNSGTIIVKFDKELSGDNDWASYITLSNANNSVPVDINYSDKTLYINYNKLSASTKYTLQINGGLKGIEAAAETEAFTMSFTTKVQAEAVTASLTTPSRLTDVSISTKILIAFSDSINWESGSEVLVTLYQDRNLIECEYSYFASNNFLTLTPTNNLSYNKNYTINISKLLTKAETDQLFEFSTQKSASTPAISADTSKSAEGKFYLVSGQKFYIDLNRTITDEVAAKYNIYMEKGGAAFNNYSAEFDTAKQVVTITVNVPFEANQTYTVGVKEFADSDGYVIKAAQKSFSAISSIAVASVELDCGSGWQTASGSSEVALFGKIKVTFSKPVPPSAVKFVDQDGSELTEPFVTNKTSEKSSIIEFDYNGINPLSTYSIVASYTETITGQSVESGVYTFTTISMPDTLVLLNQNLPNSESNPYLVYCAKALDQIREEDYLGKGYYFKQMADIDLSQSAYTSPTNTPENGWEPLGEANDDVMNPFVGHYDGNNMTISNLTITDPSQEHASLFGVIINGSVINLNIENVEINGLIDVGTIAGAAGTITIRNCHSSGNIVSQEFGAGGLISYIEEFIDISNSSSSANITIIGTEISSDAGGLLGCVEDGCISGCQATGKVKGYMNVGGLVGTFLIGTIKDCSTSNSSVEGDLNVGGILGYNTGSVTNCNSSSNVSGDDCIGGIIGFNEYPGSFSGLTFNGEVHGNTERCHDDVGFNCIDL